MSFIKKIVLLNRKYSKYLSEKYPKFFENQSYQDELLKRIYKSIEINNIKNILEVGGIDRPLLTKGNEYSYDGLDIEAKDKCYEIYDNFFIQSIETKVADKYDLIISITLLEHVPDNKSSIDSIYQSINLGGQTHHYLPSKWHPYAIALRLVGPRIQKKLIPIIRPGTENVTGYPAFFNYCSIPSMRALFLNTGFIDIDIKPYYRANDYFAFFTPLFIIITAFENFCKKLRLEIFASGFVISAKVPSNDSCK